MIQLLKKNEIPVWVQYPQAYLDLVSSGRDEFMPWYLMDKGSLLIRWGGLKQNYPTRDLFPFARHDYTDDIACWEKNKPGKVILIHDFASPGYENKMEFDSFEQWYEYVLTFLEED